MADEVVEQRPAPVGFIGAGATGPTLPGRPVAPPGPVLPSAFDRLGPRARAIVLPGVIVILLAIAGVVTGTIGFVGVLSAVDDAEVFADGPQVTFQGADALACSTEQRAVSNAVASYRLERGGSPASTSDLVPEFLRRTPDLYRVVDGEVEPRRGSPCTLDGGLVTEATREERSEALREAASDSSSFWILLLGSALLAGAICYQGWWLATAYRCLPRGRQIHRPRRAYGPIVVYAVYWLAGAAISAVLSAQDTAIEEPIMYSAIVVVFAVSYLFLLVRALLRGIDMLGDVTFHFCNGQYLTSRLMRLSLKGFFLVPVVGAILVFSLSAAGAGDAAAWVLLMTWLIGLVLCPSVAFVSYGVAVVLAILGVQRTLSDAARELTRTSAAA